MEGNTTISSTTSDEKTVKSNEEAIQKIQLIQPIHAKEMTSLQDITFKLALCALISVILNVIQLEIAFKTSIWHNRCKDVSTPCQEADFFYENETLTTTIIRILITLLSIAMIVMIIMFHHSKLRYEKTRYLVHPTLPLYKMLLYDVQSLVIIMMEIIFISIHPFPGINVLFQEDAQFLIISSFTVFFRYIYLVRYFYYKFPIHSQTGNFTVPNTDLTYNIDLIVKRSIEKHPVAFFTFLLSLIVLISSYMIRIMDGLLGSCNLMKIDDEMVTICKELHFYDAIWLLMVSISKIGYGQFLPNSHGSRIILSIAGAFGVFMKAMIFTLIFQLVKLNPQEANVYSFLCKQKYQQAIRKASVLVIQSGCRHFKAYQGSIAWIPSKLSENIHFRVLANRLPYEIAMKMHVSTFRNTKRLLQQESGNKDSKNEIGKKMYSTQCSLNDISKKINSISEKAILFDHDKISEIPKTQQVLSELNKEILSNAKKNNEISINAGLLNSKAVQIQTLLKQMRENVTSITKTIHST